MANNELEKICAELKEWKKLQDEANEQVKNLENQLKDEMQKRNTEELIAGRYIVRWTTFIKSAFDSNAFKQVHADLYNLFQKTSTQRRFSVCE